MRNIVVTGSELSDAGGQVYRVGRKWVVQFAILEMYCAVQLKVKTIACS
jgi:hypothetical protein